jgi:hypothetical protein
VNPKFITNYAHCAQQVIIIIIIIIIIIAHRMKYVTHFPVLVRNDYCHKQKDVYLVHYKDTALFSCTKHCSNVLSDDILQMTD